MFDLRLTIHSEGSWTLEPLTMFGRSFIQEALEGDPDKLPDIAPLELQGACVEVRDHKISRS